MLYLLSLRIELSNPMSNCILTVNIYEGEVADKLKNKLKP